MCYHFFQFCCPIVLYNGTEIYLHYNGTEIYLHYNATEIYLHYNGTEIYLHYNGTEIYMHYNGNEPIILVEFGVGDGRELVPIQAFLETVNV